MWNSIFSGCFEYPSPHTNSSPSLFNAILIFLYAAILTILVKPSTLTNSPLFAFALFPSCPFAFSPKPYTFPFVSNAKLWLFPTAILVIFTFSGNFTSCGLWYVVLSTVPKPN